MDQPDRSLIAAGVSFVLIALAWVYAAKSARLRPNEPPILPGAVPFLGHALAFGKDASKIHIEARNWTQDLQPVSLSLMGQRVYLILNPRDVAAVWRTKTLPFEPIVEWSLSRIFGLSLDCVEKLHLDPDGEGDMYENQHAYLRDALAPGPNLNQATQAFLNYLAKDMETVIQEIRKAPGNEIQIDLANWIRFRLSTSSTNAFMGERLLQHDPDIISRLVRWEADFTNLAMGLPRWMLKAAHDNLDKLHTDFQWIGKDKNMLPWLKRRIEMMEVRGIDDKDQGGSIFTLWLALQANAVPTSFWLLYHIMINPGLEDKIQAEIAPAFDSAGDLIDLDYLIKKTPLFNAAYWETLRWTSGATSVRQVEEDTVIGGKILYAGGVVMVPARANMLSPQWFGDDAEDWVADRFIRDPGGLNRVKPFGGGNTLCPGRHFASNEIFGFVATTLRKFQLSIVPGQTPAKAFTAGPNVGTFHPDRKVLATMKLRH